MTRETKSEPSIFSSGAPVSAGEIASCRENFALQIIREIETTGAPKSKNIRERLEVYYRFSGDPVGRDELEPCLEAEAFFTKAFGNKSSEVVEAYRKKEAVALRETRQDALL